MHQSTVTSQVESSLSGAFVVVSCQRLPVVSIARHALPTHSAVGGLESTPVAIGAHLLHLCKKARCVNFSRGCSYNPLAPTRLYPLPATCQLICQPCNHHSQRVIPDDCGTASPLQLVFKPSDALGRP